LYAILGLDREKLASLDDDTLKLVLHKAYLEQQIKIGVPAEERSTFGNLQQAVDKIDLTPYKLSMPLVVTITEEHLKAAHYILAIRTTRDIYHTYLEELPAKITAISKQKAEELHVQALAQEQRAHAVKTQRVLIYR
jgi:hypothetical protein